MTLPTKLSGYLSRFLPAAALGTTYKAWAAHAWLQSTGFGVIALLLIGMVVRMFWKKRKERRARMNCRGNVSWDVYSVSVRVGAIDDADLARIEEVVSRDKKVWALMFVDYINKLARCIVLGTGAAFGVLFLLGIFGAAVHPEIIITIIDDITTGDDRSEVIRALGQLCIWLLFFAIIAATFLMGRFTNRREAMRLRLIGREIGHPLTPADEVALLDGQLEQRIADSERRPA